MGNFKMVGLLACVIKSKEPELTTGAIETAAAAAEVLATEEACVGAITTGDELTVFKEVGEV